MRIAQVVCSDSFAGVERYISSVAEQLAAKGCEVVVIGGDIDAMAHISGRVCVRPATSTIAAIAELSRLGRVDVVHAHMTAADLAAVLTKFRHHARLVTTRHFARRRGSGTGATILRHLDRYMDEEIAISQYVADSVGARRVLLNGVKPADPGPSTRDRSVLVMQRLEAEKHTELALHAWAVSQLRFRGWRLLIAGRGSQLPRLKQLTEQLGIKESVDCLGFVSEPSSLLSTVGMLLATAPAEPFGLTVVEAMARATPVIAANGGAHRETIGHDGWLFPVDDAVACAQLLNNAETQNAIEYGERLRARQRQLFDLFAHTDALLSIYEQLTT